MGMRKYQRQVAKARMRALGVDRINRRFATVQDGIKNWRRALTGATGEAGRKALAAHGIKAKRKIRKIERTATA